MQASRPSDANDVKLPPGAGYSISFVDSDPEGDRTDNIQSLMTHKHQQGPPFTII